MTRSAILLHGAAAIAFLFFIGKSVRRPHFTYINERSNMHVLTECRPTKSDNATGHTHTHMTTPTTHNRQTHLIQKSPRASAPFTRPRRSWQRPPWGSPPGCGSTSRHVIFFCFLVCVCMSVCFVFLGVCAWMVCWKDQRRID